MGRYAKFIAALIGAGAVIATQYGYAGEYSKVATAVESLLAAFGVYLVSNSA